MLSECIYTSGGGGSQSYCEYNQSHNAGAKIPCGFKPKKIIVTMSAGGGRSFVYDEDVSTTSAVELVGGQHFSTNIGTANSYVFASIDNDGFTLGNYYGTGYTNFYCIAIG